MKSEFVFSPVSNVIKTTYGYSGGPSNVSYSIHTNLPKEHTYVIVLATYQQDIVKFLQNTPEINVLYISKPAFNTHHGGIRNQQTLVVFEFK